MYSVGGFVFLLQEFSGNSSFLRSLLVFVPVIAIFWFLVISPQRKEEKNKKEMIKNLKKGDKVLTVGGIFGVVKKLGDTDVILELSPNNEAVFIKNSIEKVLSEKNEVKKGVV
ncbi:preprotein translocase subunit YajC [Borreliella carolinensis]|uniref:Sec translocon accessory complex subunit YajC n=1 Tax=Borreliella carolinensis TaxID=478174 RepID=A0ABY9E856_9SPIR|nr:MULTISPECIES: preprotein translocase subunit YajC [Borreliella]MCD2401170.1 preprotein translocase subunit YajC [Borreliella bissettiae]WKC91216.1 preprotein translocase subunit YajC [Borreliella carolinensis]WKD00253.1 preprotein translocase subunit YajC [Borreliella bissettiae]WNY63281.1 preprotein translocase subunit YajC [Borreliella carolinensis]WNY65375.1 preprotein translocase subunit YajC [Borreliella carolinensis]